ncbi:MAG: response regulator [Lachnospiraceae bacterium]|nr:response regulator [Lachnospiraceae bacterium]
MQRILVVDDTEVNRELLHGMLKDDYIVELAEDGEQAVQKLQQYQGESMALLLDLQLPKLDGFGVLEEMRENGWLGKIPVLVISGEQAAEVENRCFELGVSDFIRKPFEVSIVKNRVKKTLELFTCKNQLEAKVERQTERLRRQHRLIQLQAEKLKETRPFNELMMQYRSAIMEVEAKLRILNDEFSLEYNRNPFESIKSRLKSPESIYEKLTRKGVPVTVNNIRENLADVAGVRVICSFPDDIYRLAELFIRQDDIILLKRKDYIKIPKNNGYRRLHIIIEVPIYLSSEKIYRKVEVQIRTIAMDFWASLEYKLKYKKDVENAEEIVKRLKTCADSIELLDYQMQEIRNEIDRTRP